MWGAITAERDDNREDTFILTRTDKTVDLRPFEAEGFSRQSRVQSRTLGRYSRGPSGIRSLIGPMLVDRKTRVYGRYLFAPAS